MAGGKRSKVKAFDTHVAGVGQWQQAKSQHAAPGMSRKKARKQGSGAEPLSKREMKQLRGGQLVGLPPLMSHPHKLVCTKLAYGHLKGQDIGGGIETGLGFCDCCQKGDLVETYHCLACFGNPKADNFDLCKACARPSGGKGAGGKFLMEGQTRPLPSLDYRNNPPEQRGKKAAAAAAKREAKAAEAAASADGAASAAAVGEPCGGTSQDGGVSAAALAARKAELGQAKLEQERKGMLPGETFNQFRKRLERETKAEVLKDIRSSRKVPEKRKAFLNAKKRDKKMARKAKARAKDLDRDSDDDGERDTVAFGEQAYRPPLALPKPARRAAWEGAGGAEGVSAANSRKLGNSRNLAVHTMHRSERERH